MRKLMLLVGLLALAACGGDTPPPTVGDFTHIGAWTLTSVDEKSLPTVISTSSTACGLTVDGGTLTLRQNGTYTMRMDYGPEGCEAEWESNGTYSIATNDRDITLVSESGAFTTTVAYFGIAIDWTSQGRRYTFQKP